MSLDFWIGAIAGALLTATLVVATGWAVHVSALRALAAERRSVGVDQP